MRHLAIALLTTVIAASCNSRGVNRPATATSDEPAADARPKAPEFDLANLKGGSLKSADLKGKVVIVDFWATWCAPCIHEAPELNAIYEKYKDRGVELVGVTIQSGDADDVEPKVEELKMKYPIVLGDDKIENGFGGLMGLPMTYVLAKDWTIDKRYIGSTPFKKASIEKELDRLLAQ